MLQKSKIERRRKISRKLIFGLLRRCVAFQRHYGGPWSILDETIWSLTSPRAKRISGSKNFRSPPQKDFCNNIRQQQTFEERADMSAMCPIVLKKSANWQSGIGQCDRRTGT